MIAAMLIDSRTAGLLLGLAPDEVAALAARREIPHVRLPGNRLRFDRDELVAWARRWSVSPQAETAEVFNQMQTRSCRSADMSEIRRGRFGGQITTFDDGSEEFEADDEPAFGQRQAAAPDVIVEAVQEKIAELHRLLDELPQRVSDAVSAALAEQQEQESNDF